MAVTRDMASVILTVEDEGLLAQIKRACMLLKGVVSVRVEHSKAAKAFDVTQTAGYKEAMEDVKRGRVTRYDSVESLFADLGISL